MIMLEESNKRTLQGLSAYSSQNITVDRSGVADDDITAAFDLMFGPICRLCIYTITGAALTLTSSVIA